MHGFSRGNYIASCLSHFKREIKDVLLDRIEHEYFISNSHKYDSKEIVYFKYQSYLKFLSHGKKLCHGYIKCQYVPHMKLYSEMS